MEETIFTKIINGDIPSHKVYEDDKTFVFMDIHPIQPGHVLVVSKTPYETFLDMPDDDYIALFKTVKLIGKKLKTAFPDKKRIAVVIEGLEVNHVHVKLFPIDTGADLHTIPDTNAEVDHQELAKIATRIAQ